MDIALSSRNSYEIGMQNRIAEIRAAQKLSQEKLAELLHASRITVSKLERGVMQLTPRWMERLGEALHVEPVELLVKPGAFRQVQVRGALQAGVFSESFEWPEGEWYDVAVPDDPGLRPYTLYGAQVRGPSMNRRYPEGTSLVMTDVIETQEELRIGKRYHVERRRADGMVEATVKKLWQDETGRFWLVPESDDPRYQEPIGLDGEDGDEIRIVGRVVFVVHRE